MKKLILIFTIKAIGLQRAAFPVPGSSGQSEMQGIVEIL